MRPKVFVATPHAGWVRDDSACARFVWSRGPGHEVVLGGANGGSLLTKGFNHIWATALNYQKAGLVTHLCMLHADIEVGPGWLTTMLGEMASSGAAVLSAVVPIKDQSGDTSTAVETANVWGPRRLGLAECLALPPTFRAEDVPGNDGPLLVNTGLLLVDLSLPAWWEREPDGGLYFKFTMRDRVAEGPDGQLRPQCQSEDWEWSRRLASCGIVPYATTAVPVVHHGDQGFATHTPDPDPADVTEVLADA
jgi:hypothetical protein